MLTRDRELLEDKMESKSAKNVEVDHNSSVWKILIVDDEIDIHTVTVMTLQRLTFENKELEFLHAYSAAEAKAILAHHADIAIALLDVVMEDEAAGLHLVRYIRESLKNDTIRIVLRTGNPGQAPEESVTLDYDINDYRGKTEITALGLRTMIVTALRSYKAIITIKNLNKEIEETQKELIYTLGEIAEFRSSETGHHVKIVGELSEFIGSKLGMTRADQISLGLAASMHDLGKIAIDDHILNKPGKLTVEEFAIVKKHSILGHEILKNSNRALLRLAAVIAKEHHENYDGSGYPEGLAGEEISLVSRIVAIVDVFDALGSQRVYKDAWNREEIEKFLIEQKGRKFDPVIVELFLTHMYEIIELKKSLSE